MAQPATPNQNFSVSDATFPWLLSSWIKSKTLIATFPRYWWSQNSANWLEKRHNWTNSTKSQSQMLSWWLIPSKKLRYQLILSRDATIKEYDCIRGTTDHTKSKVAVSDPTFPWWLSSCKKSLVSIHSFRA